MALLLKTVSVFEANSNGLAIANREKCLKIVITTDKPRTHKTSTKNRWGPNDLEESAFRNGNTDGLIMYQRIITPD